MGWTARGSIPGGGYIFRTCPDLPWGPPSLPYNGYRVFLGGKGLSSRLLSKNLKIKIYRTIILPVLLYGCETWSLTLREERRLRVFENRVLRKVFGPKRDEVTGEWRKLHNEELNDLYSLPNIVRVLKSRQMRWAGHVARMGKDRGVQRVLVGEA